MTIKFPSIKQYLTGLIATLVLFTLFYLLLESFKIISLEPLQALLIGLVVGQLIGVIAISSTRGTRPAASTNNETQTIYVGNLPFKTTRYELSELFLPFGKVHSARIMIDKVTRKPRGYGFVEMDRKNALKAINKLNGTSFIGRNLKVNEANERS
jgi:hypothetical protein